MPHDSQLVAPTPPNRCAIIGPVTAISAAPSAVNAKSVIVTRRCAYATIAGLPVRSASAFHTAVTMMLPRKITTPRTCNDVVKRFCRAAGNRSSTRSPRLRAYGCHHELNEGTHLRRGQVTRRIQRIQGQSLVWPVGEQVDKLAVVK
jgi:hypothetical protein